MVVTIAILISFVCCFLCCAQAKSSFAANAAIPRAKKSFLSNRWLDQIAREVKISFSSELEALVLQVTRPTNKDIPLSSIEVLTSFVNTEFDHPEQLVSLLAKISRKFSEARSFTQIKAALSLHSVLVKSSDKARVAWARAVVSMKSETDEKTQDKFFSSDSLESAASFAYTAQELAATELARLYADYVFHLMELFTDKTLSPAKPEAPSNSVSTKKIQLLLQLSKKSFKATEATKVIDSALTRQCLDAISRDRQWIIKLLRGLYDQDKVESKLIADVEEVLRTADSQFMAKRRNSSSLPGKTETPDTISESITSNSTKTSSKPTPSIPKSLRQSVARSIGSKAAPPQPRERSPATTKAATHKSTASPRKANSKPSDKSGESPKGPRKVQNNGKRKK